MVGRRVSAYFPVLQFPKRLLLEQIDVSQFKLSMYSLTAGQRMCFAIRADSRVYVKQCSQLLPAIAHGVHGSFHDFVSANSVLGIEPWTPYIAYGACIGKLLFKCNKLFHPCFSAAGNIQRLLDFPSCCSSGKSVVCGKYGSQILRTIVER